MKVNVKGTILEKFPREVKKFDGSKEERLYLRLYQAGERVNLDVHVKPTTYTSLKEGQVVELEDIKITSYKDNLYATQG